MLVASSIPIRTGKANPTTISVSPTTKTVQVEEEFTIDILLDSAENLYGYEIWLSYDKSKLTANAIDYKSYLNEPYHIWYQQVNNTGGYVTLSVSSTYPATPKTGGSPPPLATINFTATGMGSSTLHLYNTILANNQSLAIPHTTIDGTVYVTGAGVHDVAITAVSPMKTIVGQNYTCSINVTVANHGDYTETFNVTLYANATVIATIENISLANATLKTVAFVWNTTGFVKGNYTIWAYAWPVQGETHIADNTFMDGWVKISIYCDVNGDGIVDISDILDTALAFGATPGEPRWNPNCDIDDNGIIDISDILEVALHYGETDP
jgi:hypothetical protein